MGVELDEEVVERFPIVTFPFHFLLTRSPEHVSPKRASLLALVWLSLARFHLLDLTLLPRSPLPTPQQNDLLEPAALCQVMLVSLSLSTLIRDSGRTKHRRVEGTPSPSLPIASTYLSNVVRGAVIWTDIRRELHHRPSHLFLQFWESRGKTRRTLLEHVEAGFTCNERCTRARPGESERTYDN